MSLQWNDPTAAIHTAVSQGLQDAAEHLLEQANRTVPIESDELRNSGTASTEGFTAQVGYNTDYAVIQHERLDLHHDGQGQAKWLEKAARAEQSAVVDAIADAIRTAT